MKLFDTVKSKLVQSDDPWVNLCCQVRELANKLNMSITIHTIESNESAFYCTEIHNMIRSHKVFCCVSNKSKLRIKVLNGSEESRKILQYLVDDMIHYLNTEIEDPNYICYTKEDHPGYIFASPAK